MTNSQKLQIRQSEIRQRLNELSAPEAESTDESKAEISKLFDELNDLEPKLRAAITAEQAEIEARNDGNPDTSDPRLDDLKQRASVSEYVRQAINGQPLEGACRELNDELKIVPVRGQGGGVLLPVEQLAMRADVANTSTTAADADETNRRPIFSRLFARGVMEALGVRLDSVPVGMIEYPILVSATTPAMKAEGTEAADTVAATWNSETLKPKRLVSQYEFTAEALATVPGLDAALSADLQMAITDQMNALTLGDGDGTAPNVRGLGTAINFKVANIPDPNAEVTQADALDWPLLVIDGLHASTESDCSIVIGPETYKKIAPTLFSGTTENVFDVWRRRGITFVSSAHIKTTSHIDRVYVHGGRDMARGDSVGAVWPAMELIRDPYSKAGEGKTMITSTLLWDLYSGFRAAAYKGAKAKVSS